MLSNSQKKLLALMLDPRRSANVRWRDIEALLRALGVEIKQRGKIVVVLFPIAGSDKRATWSSHVEPDKQLGKGTVKSIVDFIRAAGLDKEAE